MLQSICFSLAAIPATVHVGSCVPLPNWKAAGRSTGTAGLWAGDKQFEELRNEGWSRAKFRTWDKKIPVSSQCTVVLFWWHKTHLGVARLFADCTSSKEARGKKGFDVFSKQIAVLKDLQFLLACCKQLCLKKNKHPKGDRKVGSHKVLQSTLW